MKLTVTSGDRQVVIEARGKSPKALRRLEKAASRLLAAGPTPPPPKPFGFSLVADTELSGQDD